MARVYWLHLKEHTDIYSEGYIGVSDDPFVRLKTHKVNPNRHLKFAFQKYGDCITLTIIDEGNEEYCYERESILRPDWDIGWNIQPGGNKPPRMVGQRNPSYGKPGNRLGMKNTKEQNEKIARSRKGRARPPFSEEWRRNISQSLKGNTRNKGKGKHQRNNVNG